LDTVVLLSIGCWWHAKPPALRTISAFDQLNRIVMGNNPFLYDASRQKYFPGVYRDPLSPSSTDADSIVNDYQSMASSAIFDGADNLQMGDLNRGRVLMYDHPLCELI